MVWNDGAPEGLLVFNYAATKGKLPAADTIDTLTLPAIMNELTRDDPEPFFSIQAIRFPATGNGLRYGSIGIYHGAAFDSFISKTKEGAIPGSKFGHEWSPKPSNDFYMVGGKTVYDADGKSGTAYFKMYIPPKGYTTENYGFIRDVRARLGNYSLVMRPKYTVKTNSDGVEEYHITGSLGDERNDAVEKGAMSQVVNSASASLDLDAAKALIEAGDFDRETKVDGNPIQNGRVYRSALRVMLSRANEDDRSALGDLVSMIDRSTNQRNGGKSVETKEEALAILKNAIANSQITLADIAKGVGLESLIRNAQDEANAATVKVLNEKLGDKPLERLEAVITENAANAEFAIEKAVAVVAGPKTVKNAGGQDVENPAHKYAAEKCKGLSGDALKNAADALKDDAVMKVLNAQRADGESELNRVEHGGATDKTTNSADDGIPTVRVSRKE
jgi:hypothetical protein